MPGREKGQELGLPSGSRQRHAPEAWRGRRLLLQHPSIADRMRGHLLRVALSGEDTVPWNHSRWQRERMKHEACTGHVTCSGVTHQCFCFATCIDAAGFCPAWESLSSVSPGPSATSVLRLVRGPNGQPSGLSFSTDPSGPCCEATAAVRTTSKGRSTTLYSHSSWKPRVGAGHPPADQH